jgi:hypothetical protein
MVEARLGAPVRALDSAWTQRVTGPLLDRHRVPEQAEPRSSRVYAAFSPLGGENGQQERTGDAGFQRGALP